MTTICIGPVCIPVNALLPFLLLLLQPLLDWCRKITGAKQKAEERGVEHQKPGCCRSTLTSADSSSSNSNGDSNKDTGLKQRKTLFGPGIQYAKSEEEYEKFQSAANTIELPMVVKFTAKWCKPCRAIAPVFKELAENYDSVFVEVDVDELAELCDRLSVSTLPTFKIFLGGKEIESFNGATAILSGGLEKKLRKAVAAHCQQVSTSL